MFIYIMLTTSGGMKRRFPLEALRNAVITESQPDIKGSPKETEIYLPSIGKYYVIETFAEIGGKIQSVMMEMQSRQAEMQKEMQRQAEMEGINRALAQASARGIDPLRRNG